MDCYWIRNSEYELEALRDASESVAVIPLASIESHGPHLPLGADPLAQEHLLERIIAKETVAVLPIVHYSYVGEARMLPGAIHMPSDLLMDMVEQICDEVHRNGFDKVVLLHGHGGNVALHWMFCKRMLERDKPYAVYSIPVFGSRGEEITAICDGGDMGHACEMETSMDMVAFPDLVKLDVLGDKRFPMGEHPDVGAAHTPVEWVSRWREMAVGDPQKATAEKGEKILSIWCDEVVDILRKIKADTVTLSEMKRYTAQTNGHRGEVGRTRDIERDAASSD